MTDDDSELSQDSVEEKKNLDIDIDVTEDPEINNTLKEETYDEIIKEKLFNDGIAYYNANEFFGK